MRNVLVIGYKDYIDNAVVSAIRKTGQMEASQFDILGVDPEMIDFDQYDTIIYAAGIEPTIQNDKQPKSYYETNRDLAFHVAYIAKKCKVRQMVILSTIDVYGTSKATISDATKEDPETDYSKSKYEADEKIRGIQSEDFRVSIVRLPHVVSANMTAYAKLSHKIHCKKFKRRTEISNIDTVCQYIIQIVKGKKQGTFIAL